MDISFIKQIRKKKTIFAQFYYIRLHEIKHHYTSLQCGKVYSPLH